MGSQALGSASEATSGVAGDAPDVGTRRVRPRPRTIAALFAAAWVLPVLTQLTSADPLIVLVVVFGTGGLFRVGSTVVDRLMATLALLIGLAITAGYLFTYWPWGLQPLALGEFALTLLAAAYVWLGAPPPWRTWPRRLLGSDIVLLIAGVFGALVAYWPSFSIGVPDSSKLGDKVSLAAFTGDRSRQFSLFDAIHRFGGYTFLMQGQARSSVDPEVLGVYPPGAHYIYALADIFARSSMDPGDPVRELQRYNIWTSIGYGFFVLCVAWAARWVAGPFLKGWRRVFLVTAVAAYLSVGAYTSAIWCTWDSQVFSMALIALLAAFCFRPPQGVRAYAALLALIFISICFTYSVLYGLVGAVLIAVSLVVYRRRLLPHWKMLLAVTVVAAPLALIQYAVADSSGLNGGSALQATGFTIPLSWVVLTAAGVAALAGFATRAARRRPSAVAGLASAVLCGLAVLAVQFFGDGGTYYPNKFIQAWVLVMLVGAGTFGHLLRRPALPARGWSGALAGTCAFVLAIGATHSFWWSTDFNAPLVASTNPNGGGDWAPSASSSWAGWWMARQHMPSYANPYQNLADQNMLADNVPTIAIISPSAGDNVNFSLQLATFNRNTGTMSPVLYGTARDPNAGLNSTNNLFDPVSMDAPLNAGQLSQLTQLEAGMQAVGERIRVIVPTKALDAAFKSYAAMYPGVVSSVLFEPNIDNPPSANG